MRIFIDFMIFLGNQRTSNRNLQCLSSDDEEEEEEDDDDDEEEDSDNDSQHKAIPSYKKKSNVPLPSDEEGKK